jgi:uncharacterized membrane protein
MTAPASPDKRILIARFAAVGGAEAGLSALRSRGVRLGNAAIVEAAASGEVAFRETQDWGMGKSALVGALAAIILPGIGPIVGAAAGALAAYLIDAGFPDPLLKQVGATFLTAGQSALVALVDAADTDLAQRAVTGVGGTVLGAGSETDLGALLARLGTTGA